MRNEPAISATDEPAITTTGATDYYAPKTIYAVTHESGDTFNVADTTSGATHQVTRWTRADNPLKAICDCGGVYDKRAPLEFCDHIIALDIYIERENGNEDNAQRMERVCRLQVVAAAIPDASPEPIPAEPANAAAKAPCASLAVRRCAAVAAEHGLNFRHKEGRRAAASMVVGNFIESCKELSVDQWRALADEVKNWGLRWDERDAWYDGGALRGGR